MLYSNHSGNAAPWEYGFLIFVFAGLMLTISCSTDAEEEEEQLEAPVTVEAKDIMKQPDEPPKFPGGKNELVTFLLKNVTYPDEARKDGVEGTVHVSFVVTQEGKVTNIKLVNPIHKSLDKEALQVVQKMPDWIPAKKNGQPVNVQMTLPVQFEL